MLALSNEVSVSPSASTCYLGFNFNSHLTSITRFLLSLVHTSTTSVISVASVPCSWLWYRSHGWHIICTLEAWLLQLNVLNVFLKLSWIAFSTFRTLSFALLLHLPDPPILTTHSLTAALDQLRVVASSTSNDEILARDPGSTNR